MVAAPSLLDELLAPVCEAFSPEVAARLVALRASPSLQARLDELAHGHREGRLSPDDESEHAALVQAVAVVAVLQARARNILAAA